MKPMRPIVLVEALGRGLGAAALAVSLAAPAVAQDRPWEVTLVGGAAFGSRVVTLQDLETRIDTAGLAGVRVARALNRSFRLEAGWTHTSADLVSRDPSAGEPYRKSGEVDTDCFELDVFYEFGGAATRGYFGLGAGAMSISPPVPTLSESQTRFAANAAVGLRQALGSRFALRVEGRYRWRDGKSRVGTIYCGEGECVPFTTNWYTSEELTLGLSYSF